MPVDASYKYTSALTDQVISPTLEVDSLWRRVSVCVHSVRRPYVERVRFQAGSSLPFIPSLEFFLHSLMRWFHDMELVGLGSEVFGLHLLHPRLG